MNTRSPFFKKHHFAGLALAVIATLIFALAAQAQAVAGGLDPNFGTNGKVVTYTPNSNSSANAVAIQSDGKIIVAGTPLLTRYNSDGSVDTSFGTNGIVNVSGIIRGNAVAIQPDGKILVARNPGFGVARLNSNGSLDTSFGTNGIASHDFATSSNTLQSGNVRSIVLQSDGKITVGGEVSNCCGNVWSWYAVVRYNSDGSFDSADVDGVGNASYNTALVIQPDGKILFAGNSYDGNAPQYNMVFMRWNPDFTPDLTLWGGQNGFLETDFGNVGFYDYSIAVQPNGKIIAVGQLGCSEYCQGSSGYKFAIARFNSDGSTDTTFGTNGVVTNNFNLMADLTNNPDSEMLKNIVVQPDGKFIIGLDTYDGTHYHFLLVRFNGDGSLDTSFGTNGEIITAFGDYDDHIAAIVLQPDGKIITAGSSSNGTTTGIAMARYIAGTIAPTTTITLTSQAGSDGWILESAAGSGVGGTQNAYATTLIVGDDILNRQYRSILSFNTASLPHTAIITSAALMVKIQGVAGTDPLTTHGNLLADIRNGHFNNTVGLDPADFSAPASPGSDQQQLTPLLSNWFGFNLSTANLGFISKVGVTQFRLRFSIPTNNDKIADYLTFYSGDAAHYQPELIVTYYVP